MSFGMKLRNGAAVCLFAVFGNTPCAEAMRRARRAQLQECLDTLGRKIYSGHSGRSQMWQKFAKAFVTYQMKNGYDKGVPSTPLGALRKCEAYFSKVHSKYEWQSGATPLNKEIVYVLHAIGRLVSDKVLKEAGFTAKLSRSQQKRFTDARNEMEKSYVTVKAHFVQKAAEHKKMLHWLEDAANSRKRFHSATMKAFHEKRFNDAYDLWEKIKENIRQEKKNAAKRAEENNREKKDYFLAGRLSGKKNSTNIISSNPGWGGQQS